MLALGIIILLVFVIIGIVLVVKGVRQGDAVDAYNTPGKMYVGMGVFAVILGLGISIFCFVKNAELNSGPYSYSGSNGGSSVTSSFTNKYGTSTTKCAISGCNNYIAKSGDTNCCTTHSRRCGNCNCYIDSDAMYCMTCISGAVGGGSSGSKSSSSSSHECYVCGSKAYSKYGSYYYCASCLELVKAFSD